MTRLTIASFTQDLNEIGLSLHIFRPLSSRYKYLVKNGLEELFGGDNLKEMSELLRDYLVNIPVVEEPKFIAGWDVIEPHQEIESQNDLFESDNESDEDLYNSIETKSLYKNSCDLEGFCTVESLPVLPEDIETHPVFLLAVASAVLDQIVTTFKPVVDYVMPKMLKQINCFSDMIVQQFSRVKARGFDKKCYSQHS